MTSGLLAEHLPPDRVNGTRLKRERKESGSLSDNGSSRNCEAKEKEQALEKEKEGKDAAKEKEK